MADKSKILQNAQRFMAKGQIDKAIAEWKKLISESPNDGNIYNTIGDLYLKKKQTDLAVQTYLKGAEAFREAGFALKTIAVYKKLIKLAPDQIEIQVKLGDLNVERGLTNNAIQDYLGAAKSYSTRGKTKESLDVYRKIADLDPSKTSNRVKLAEMCLKAGLKLDAVTELAKLAKFFNENGKTKEAGEVQNNIGKIDPSGSLLETANRLLDTAVPGDAGESKEKEDPLSEADEFIEKQDYEKARGILDSLVKEKPDDPVVHEKLGKILLITEHYDQAFDSINQAVNLHKNNKDFKSSENIIKELLEVDPHRIGAHILLGEVYELMEKKALAVTAFAQAIDEYLIAGETASAREIYIRIEALDPEHRDVRRLRHSCGTEAAPPSKAAYDTMDTHEAALESTLESAQEEAGVGETPLPETPSPQSSDELPVEGSQAPLVDPASLEEYFTEAEVFVKYGLPEKAIDQMNKVLALDPENTAAHEKLKELYLNQDDKEKGLEACFQLMALYKELGETEKYESALTEARNIDPENPRVREATDLVPGLDSGRLNAILEESGPKAGYEAPSLELEGIEATQENTLERQAPEAADAGLGGQALEEDSPSVGMEEPAAHFDEKMAEADFYNQQGLVEEARKIYEMILAQDPGNEDAREKLKAMAKPAGLAEETLEEVQPEEVQKEPVSETQEAGQAQGSFKSEEEIALEADLDQSFSVYTVDNNAGPDSAPPNTGSQPVVQQWSANQEKSQEEIDLEEDLDKSFSPYMTNDTESPPAEASPPASQTAPADPQEEGLVDLSGLLDGEEVGAELEDLFSDYEKEPEVVEEEEADYETHYNLGIAYKEMGLMDEAIGEFEKAVKGPDRFVDSSHMLATCFQETGRSSEALELLQKALSGSGLDLNQELYLRYDIGSINEKDGRLQEALDAFQEISRKEPAFKDVGSRVKKIQAKLSGTSEDSISTSVPPLDEEEDLELMMNRVFGETSSPDNEASGKVGAADTKKKDKISYL